MTSGEEGPGGARGIRKTKGTFPLLRYASSSSDGSNRHACSSQAAGRKTGPSAAGVGVGEGEGIGVAVAVGAGLAVRVAVADATGVAVASWGELSSPSESQTARRAVAMATKSSAAPASGSRGSVGGGRAGPAGGRDQFQPDSRGPRRPRGRQHGPRRER